MTKPEVAVPDPARMAVLSEADDRTLVKRSRAASARRST
jgi:hypothetical protein